MNRRELAAVLTGLRLLQQHPAVVLCDPIRLSPNLREVFTDSGHVLPLDADELDALAERLNCTPLGATRVAINVCGGVVDTVASDGPVRVRITNEDTDGADDAELTVVRGEVVRLTETEADTDAHRWLDAVFAARVPE